MALAPGYPSPAYAFSVAVVSGTSVSSVVETAAMAVLDAAFQEISGIESHVDVEEIAEGGVNDYVHQLPGVTKHSNLVLKRGYVVQISPLALWAGQCVGGTLGSPLETKTVIVFLLGPDGQPTVMWTFLNAWPVKWEVGTLDATNSTSVLTHTLEISYTTVSTTLVPAAA